MPTDSLILSIAIVAMFAFFALPLAWAERRTRRKN